MWVTLSEGGPGIELSNPGSQAGTLAASITSVGTEDKAPTIMDWEAHQPGDLTAVESQPPQANVNSHDANIGTTWGQDPEDPSASQPSGPIIEW